MRWIEKGREPSAWLAYRKRTGDAATFDDGPKAALRTALLAEQGALCCYCMARIRDGFGGMKVEHWAPRGAHPEVDYTNLLATCQGGEGSPPRTQHCDTAKADHVIGLDPRSPDCERRISYTIRGEVVPRESADEQTLNDLRVLNLNLARLRGARAEMLGQIQLWASAKGGTRTRNQLEQQIRTFETPNAAGQLPPFVGVAVSWLRKHAAQR